MNQNPCYYWNRPKLTMPTTTGKGLPTTLMVQSVHDPATSYGARRLRPQPVRRIAAADRHRRGRPRGVRRREQVRRQDHQHVPHHRQGAGQGRQLQGRGNSGPGTVPETEEAATAGSTTRTRRCAGSPDSPRRSPDICTDIPDAERLSPLDREIRQFSAGFPLQHGQFPVTVGEIRPGLSLSGQICQGDVRVASLCDSSVISTTLSQRGGTGRRPGGLDEHGPSPRGFGRL